MADTVKLPLLKKPLPKKTAILFGVGGAAVIGYALYRRHVNSVAASTAPSTAVDTSTVDPNLDPATGFDFGTAADEAALSSENSLGSGTGTVTGGGSTGNIGVIGTVISTNDQWEQAAIAYLTGTVGLDPATVSGALGLYITGGSVVAGSANDSIIQQAIASTGSPPVAGPSGYPPSIRHTAAGPTAPKVTPLATPHLSATKVNSKTEKLSWGKVTGAFEYHVYDGATITLITQSTSANVTKSGTYSVVAAPSTGGQAEGGLTHDSSLHSNSVTVKL